MDLQIVTWAASALIICTFIVFTVRAKKMQKYASVFFKASESEDPLNSLDTNKFDSIKNAYLKTTKILIDGKEKFNDPAEIFFSDQSICAAAGINMKVLDAASGILVGLGLFGTFLGLTLGIWQFESSDSEKIQKSIQSLLDGMGTAFITSLFGMMGSLAYTIIEKRWRNNFDNSISAFNNKIDSIFYIDDFSLSHHQQKKTIDEFYIRISRLLKEESGNIVTTINHQTSYTTAEKQNVTIGDAIREILINNQEQTTALKSFSTDLALELNNGFDEVLSRQMQEKILPLMQSVDATTRIVVDHIDKMADQISSPATDMINQVVHELKSSVNTMIDEFQTNISNTTTKELANLAHSLGAATDLMMNFPSNMENITSSLKQTVAEVQKAIIEISHNSAASNDATIQKMQEQIAFATTSMGESIGEVKEVMKAISMASENSTKNITNSLSSASNDMTLFMQESMSKIGNQLQDSMKSITEDISNRQVELLSIQEDSVSQLKQTVLELSESAKNSSKEVVDSIQEGSKSMVIDLNSTMETINQRIKTTLDSVMEDIQKKQSDLTSAVNNMTEASKSTSELLLENLSSSYVEVSRNMRSTMESMTQKVSDQIGSVMDNFTGNYSEVMDRQKETLEDTLTLLEELEGIIVKLKDTNKSIGSTMASFQETQSHISSSVSDISNVSDNLRVCTNDFLSSQVEYGQQIKSLESSNKEKIDAVMDLIDSLGSTTKRQTEDFEIIRRGLGDIFKQIEAGLNNYSKTVRTSLQDYLDSYTNSLTKTTDTLASTIHMQNEMVEALIDTVKPNKRR